MKKISDMNTKYPRAMKILYRLSIIAIITSNLISCAHNTSSSAISDVKTGMTREEVVSILGEPTSISAQGSRVYMNYKLCEGMCWALDPNFRETKNYYVRLIDGHVESFGHKGDFDSTKTPTVRVETDENIKTKTNGDLYTDLHKLKELRDEGILTEEEYNLQKKKIIEQH